MSRIRSTCFAFLVAAVSSVLLLDACGGAPSAPSTPPSTSPPAPSTAVLAATFGENPVPFRSTGCNASTPQGWYTTAKIQETAGVIVNVTTLIQKVDGNVAGDLSESFNSRFGACSGGSFTPGVIPASGAVCGTVGICTTSSFSSYQFQVAGTDANGHAVTVDSPVLQLGARPAGLTTSSRSPDRLTPPPPIAVSSR